MMLLLLMSLHYQYLRRYCCMPTSSSSPSLLSSIGIVVAAFAVSNSKSSSTSPFNAIITCGSDIAVVIIDIFNLVNFDVVVVVIIVVRNHCCKQLYLSSPVLHPAHNDCPYFRFVPQFCTTYFSQGGQCARVALRTLLGRAMVPLFVVQDHPMLALLASFFRSCRRQERADARKNDEISWTVDHGM